MNASMTVTVKSSTPTLLPSLRRSVIRRPERTVETWVFRLISDADRGYLLLDSYTRGKAESGRLKPKIHDIYSRSGSKGNMLLASVPLPDSVQDEARQQLLKQISVAKEI